MKGKYRADAVPPLRTVSEVSETSGSRLTLPRPGSVIAPPTEGGTPSVPVLQPSDIPTRLVTAVPAASPQVEEVSEDAHIFIAPDNDFTAVWYVVTRGRVVGVFDNK